jgi:aminopeptidase N
VASALTHAEAADRADLLQVESYQVFLDLTSGGDAPGSGDRAQSRTEIRFSCRKPGAATFADLDVVSVYEATLNGVPLDPASVTDGRLPLPELAASNTLTVDATVAVSTAGSGLTRFTDPVDGSQYVLANCFPTAAASVFCCFDQPDLLAGLLLIATLPPGWDCVANGEVLHRPDAGVAGVWRFSPVPSFKPYEFTLCAGPYVSPAAAALPTAPRPVSGDSPRLSVRCRATLAESPGLGRVANIIGAALRYYADMLGVPCPYAKLDIVFAPELGPKAMQLPAVMYVSETLLQQAADPDGEFVALVLAHEAAHLWFGCLVDGGWWDDLWLAESLASYLSYAAATAVLGQPHAWAEFAMTGETNAYQADGLPGAQPVSSPVDSAEHALTRPTSITYSKGTAVIRQLAAYIGEEAMWAGLHDYLTRHAGKPASLTDIVESWSRASGRDLTSWAALWLQQSGVNELRPEITVGPDGVITSLAVVQQPPRQQAPPESSGPLRPHQLTIGIYAQDGTRLARARSIEVTLTQAWTHIPELTGTRMPAAIVLNDTDRTFATIGIDPASWRSLVAAAMDLGDPLAEAVCWTAAWEMVQFAQLEAAEFAAIVARRMITGQLPVAFEELLARAVTGADFYSAAEQRAAARQQLAAAALSGAECAEPGGREQRTLARAFAICADSDAQLDLLRLWLAGRVQPTGLHTDLELRARMLASLAAHDRVTDADLAYAADDPVSGDVQLATLRARQPAIAAKKAAWAAALTPAVPPRLARAHAEGVWVAGQEALMADFRGRYFAEALPAMRQRDARTAQRLARLLYPATLADSETLSATDAALADGSLDDHVRAILLEQRTLLSRMITARSRI